jgi:LysM repeat protein
VLVRYLAPAAFLLAVTAVVLVVRSGLGSSGHQATTTRSVHTTSSVLAPARPRPAAVPKRYYVIQSGDTLEVIGRRFGRTVAELQRLNPGVDPRTLAPGSRLRIR